MADEFYEVLDLVEADAHYIKSIWTLGGVETWRFDKNRGRAVPPRPTWLHERSPISPHTLARALFDGDGLAPAAKRMTRIVTLDFDPPSEKVVELAERRRTLDDHLRRTTPIRKRMGAAVACGVSVRAVLDRWADLPWHVEHTGSRGYHLTLRLSRPVPVACAAALGAELLAAAGIDGKRDHVEVFPRPEGEGGTRWCSLPCTGRSRAVERDLVKLRTRTRLADAIAFLEAATVDPASFATRVPESAPAALPLPKRPPRPLAREDGRPLADDGNGLPQTRNTRRRRQWDEQMAVVMTGAPNDTSRWAVAKFAACGHYLGLERTEVRRALDSWLLLPGHRADHFATTHGRKALRNLFAHYWRRYEKGVRDGWLEPGRMRSAGIRARYAALADIGERLEAA